MLQSSFKVLRWFVTLVFFQALIFLLLDLLKIVVLGYSSPAKLITVSFLAILGVGLGWLAVAWWRNRTWTQGWTSRLTSIIFDDRIYWLLLAFMLGIFLLGFYFFLTYIFLVRSQLANLFIAPYGEMFWIYALLGVLLSGQSMVVLRLLRFGTDLSIFRSYHRAFTIFLLVIACVTVILMFMAVTRLGLTPDQVGWGAPGIPILPIQVYLAVAITSAMFMLGSFLYSRHDIKQRIGAVKLPAWGLDLFICIILWGLAVWLWGSQPLQPSYFSLAPGPPNQEFYPNSDSVHYDLTAQKLLLGMGFEPDAIRPLYVLFLAIAQGISGIGYISVIQWQVFAFAVFPVFIYLFGKTLHHRFSGMVAGLLIVMRERNAIALAGDVNTAHAKMILADLPITLGVVLFSLLLVLWLQKPRSNRLLLVVAGGTLALSMLVRTQAVILLPVALLLIMIFFWHRPSLWFRNGLMLVVTTLVVLSPWVWRTWQVTGKPGLSEMSNSTQAALIGQRYSSDLKVARGSKLPGESESEFLSRMTRSARDFALKQPVYVLRFILNHLQNNQVSTFLALPASLNIVYDLQGFDRELLNLAKTPGVFWESCCSLHAYIRDLPYWKDWDGNLVVVGFIPVAISLFLFSIGVAIAWNRWGWIALTPIAISLGYNLSNAIVRNSGWRYNLPVDWIGTLYFAVGSAQFIFWIVMFLANRLFPNKGAGLPAPRENRYLSIAFPWNKAILVTLGFTLVAASLPIAERMIPNRYADLSIPQVMETLERDINVESRDVDLGALKSFLQQPNTIATIAGGFYPRYFTAGEGENGTGSPDGTPRDFNRFGFYLADENRTFVWLPIDAPPDYFPNGAAVAVFGCQFSHYILANMVVILEDPAHVLYGQQKLPSSCSFAAQLE